MGQVKISDLSVGDWVQDKEGTPAKILGIEQWSGEYYLNVEVNGVDVGNVIAEGALPILITPEILEKNGWLPPRKAIELDTWWWTNGVDKAIEAYEYEGEWALTIIEQKEIQYRNRVGIGLKYVHQLQHALRLAGVEKEIEV